MELNCPLPFDEEELITLAHGGGGKLTDKLIEQLIVPAFSNPTLNLLHDGAFLDMPSGQTLVMTTDSFVVKPWFFPGGNIGELAVVGTCNDLSMCGAKPAYMTCSLILSEGLKIKELSQVLSAMKKAATENGVTIVTGDTKVIENKGEPELLINTAGIGFVTQEHQVAPSKIKDGDAIIVSGDIGKHGLSVMSYRANLAFEPPLMSDCASLYPYVKALQEANLPIHCLRDLTRGGLAAALCELSAQTHFDFHIVQNQIPVDESVHAACELLGLDPLHAACEGRFVCFVPEEHAPHSLQILNQVCDSPASLIGSVQPALKPKGLVFLKTPLGIIQKIDKITGEQLPRIC